MKTLIIAEAGVNHNGSMMIARQLIDAAADAGVDYVKFQTFQADKLVSRHAPKAEYQKENSCPAENSQYAMLKALELTLAQHIELIEYCNLKGVKFFSTAFDFDSIYLLAGLNLPIWKIPSGEITNLPYLRKIANTKKPVILSTGMSTLEEIEQAMEVFTEAGIQRNRITLLHCNTEYPTPMQDVNLRAMRTLAETFDVKVGYSDHTEGFEVAIAAVALGASVIEKHFTLDKTMEGPDHKASLEPDELKAMVKAIRNVELALGSTEKRVSDSEIKNKSVARKSIVAAQTIKSGDIFTEDNLTVKRPGTGISPMKWDEVTGQRATKDYQPDDLIEL